MKQNIKIGKGFVKYLKDILVAYSPLNVMLITGKESYSKSGAKNKIEQYLSKYTYVHFYDFEKNPKYKDVLKGLSVFKKNNCDLILAVGGGSVMDMGKNINAFQSHEQIDYVEFVKNNLVYVNDPSNKNEKYSRVVVRNFINNNPEYKKNIIQEFKLIRENYYKYKKMIFQIYNLINFEIHKGMIIFDSVKFLNLDQELQVKFIEITYKFFYPKKPFLRYKKVIKTLERLYKTGNSSISLSNMKVKRINSLIYFIT